MSRNGNGADGRGYSNHRLSRETGAAVDPAWCCEGAGRRSSKLGELWSS